MSGTFWFGMWLGTMGILIWTHFQWRKRVEAWKEIARQWETLWRDEHTQRTREMLLRQTRYGNVQDPQA